MKSNIEPTDDYQNLVNLLAIFSEAKNRLGKLEAASNEAYLDLVDEQKAEYAELQKVLTESDAALKELAAMHPEWFADEKTVKTPYGSVHSRKTTSHEALDAATAIARIKAALARAIKAGDELRAAELSSLIRTEETLNFDALGEVTVDDLARFGITRKVEESVTIKEQKVSLGQAVKAANKRSPKTAEAAA